MNVNKQLQPVQQLWVDDPQEGCVKIGHIVSMKLAVTVDEFSLILRHRQQKAAGRDAMTLRDFSDLSRVAYQTLRNHIGKNGPQPVRKAGSGTRAPRIQLLQSDAVGIREVGRKNSRAATPF